MIMLENSERATANPRRLRLQKKIDKCGFFRLGDNPLTIRVVILNEGKDLRLSFNESHPCLTKLLSALRIDE